MGDSRYKDNLTTLAKRLRPLMLRIAEGAVQANEWDKIIRISVDGGGAVLYEPDATGLTAALAAAVTGDMLWMPPCRIAGDYSVPANVTMASMGNNAIIEGKITLAGANSHIIGMVVENSDSSGSSLIGVDCANASGTAYINDCGITVTNSGAGDALGIIQSGAGESLIWQANSHGIASGGGDGYALQAQTGDMSVLHSKLQATTSGADSNPIHPGGLSGEALVSTVGGGKALNLWNGSSNDAPPADWETEAFDDSGWSAPVAAAHPPALTGTESIGASPTSQIPVTLRKNLVREDFSLAVAVDLRLQMRIEDHLLLGVYINGVQVVDPINTGGAGGAYNSVDHTIIAAELQGGTNVLAFEVYNADGYAIGVCYRLDGTGSGGAIQIYSCDIQNADGAESAEARLGDRSTYDVDDYASFHATDIYKSAFIHHLPAPGTAGDIVQDDGTNWIPVPGADLTSLNTEIEAGENLSAGDIVDIYDDSGAKVRKAGSDDPYPADGFVLASYSVTDTATVYLFGKLTGLSGMTPGAKQFLHTSGARSETAPSTSGYIIQEVGIALSATEMKFEPQQLILIN